MKRPKDPNKLAKLVADLASGVLTSDGKNPAAVSLGRKGGLKGGDARAKALSPERRSEIAKNAVKARWAKKKPKKD